MRLIENAKDEVDKQKDLQNHYDVGTHHVNSCMVAKMKHTYNNCKKLKKMNLPEKKMTTSQVGRQIVGHHVSLKLLDCIEKVLKDILTPIKLID